MSEFAFGIVHRVGLKHQAADALLRLMTNGKEKSILDNEVPVLIIPQEIFAFVPKTDITDLEFIEVPKGLYVPFIPEVCMLAGIEDNEKTELPMLPEFISAQSTDADCRSMFTSVGKPNMSFNVDTDGVLVRVSSLDVA